MNYKLFSIITLTLLALNKNFSQNNTECITKFQLIKMQTSSIEDIRIFLNNEGWILNNSNSYQQIKYFDYQLNYDIIEWKKYSYSNNSSLIINHTTGKPNIVIYKTNSYCYNSILNGFDYKKAEISSNETKDVISFSSKSLKVEFRYYKNELSQNQYIILVYNPIAVNKELKILKDKEIAIINAEEEKRRKYESAIQKGDIDFTDGNFNEAKKKYLIALKIDETVEVKTKIENCEKGICNQYISKGDSLYLKELYDQALLIYSKSKTCLKYKEIEDKIKITEQKIIETKINKIKNIADSFVNIQKYDLALENYNLILQIDKSNNYAKVKIEKIKNIKDILKRRSSTVFSYKNTNSNDFNKFKNLLTEEINTISNKSKNGFLNLDYKISFDTFGVNNSILKNHSSSSKNNSEKFSSYISSDILTPSIEGPFFIASQENININLKWNTNKVIFKSNSRGIFNNGEKIKENNLEKNYINQRSNIFGKYIFEVKNNELNDKTFTNINLVKFKTVGPEAALYSILMPGMGSLKASYGKKGWGRFATFIVSAGLAIGSKLYSDAQYKNYLNATSQSEIDDYYTKANISNKIALVSGGLSSAIHLYDIIWALSKGGKNKKESKILREQLKNKPIQIQNQKISITEF
jgi:hypothetical protein